MNINGTVISDGIAELEYYYGAVGSSDITFNDKEYKANQALYSHKTRSVVYAQINPSNIDFTDTEKKYKFTLVNSKGESELEIDAFEQYKTEGALTRAEATWNKGIYKLTVNENINTTAEAYALRTLDAYGNEIISAYDLKVSSTPVTSQALQNGEEDLVVDEAHDLYAIALEETKNLNAGGAGAATPYNTLDDVVDYYFELQGNPQGVTIETVEGKQVIKSVKPQTVEVTVHYLTLQGTEGTVTLTLNFHKMVELGTINVDLNKALGRTNVDIVKYLDVDGFVKDIIADNQIQPTSTGSEYNLYVDNGGLRYEAPNSGTGISAGLIKMNQDNTDNNLENGKYYFKATLQSEDIDDVNYTVKFDLKNSSVTFATCSLNINVTMNEDLFSYYMKPFWFDGNNATAYGTPNGTSGNNEVTFDMFELFAEDVNDTPAEIKESEYGKFMFSDAAEDSWIATPALDNHNLTISKGESGDMYKRHSMKVAYYPWGNENLTPIEQEFTLEFKSPFRESAKEEVEQIVFNSVSDTKTISPTVFKWIDPRTNDKFEWASNTEYSSIHLKIDETLALYLQFGNETAVSGDLKGNAAPANLGFKDKTTVPVNDVEGVMTFEVTDNWGIVSTQDVKVLLKGQKK